MQNLMDFQLNVEFRFESWIFQICPECLCFKVVSFGLFYRYQAAAAAKVTVTLIKLHDSIISDSKNKFQE